MIDDNNGYIFIHDISCLWKTLLSYIHECGIYNKFSYFTTPIGADRISSIISAVTITIISGALRHAMGINNPS